MAPRSHFTDTITTSARRGDDFIEKWKRTLRLSGYVDNRKGPLEVLICDNRLWGQRMVDQIVKIEYRIHVGDLEIMVKKDIPLEEFEILAEELIEKIK